MIQLIVNLFWGGIMIFIMVGFLLGKHSSASILLGITVTMWAVQKILLEALAALKLLTLTKKKSSEVVDRSSGDD